MHSSTRAAELLSALQKCVRSGCFAPSGGSGSDQPDLALQFWTHANQCELGEQAQLAGLNLQAEILGVNAALGETAGDKPQARLSGPREHVPQLLSIAESPDRTNAVGDIIAEQLADQMFLPFVAGR